MGRKTARLWSRKRCVYCDGTGIRAYRAYTDMGIEPAHYETCLRCNGTGLVNEARKTGAKITPLTGKDSP